MSEIQSGGRPIVEYIRYRLVEHTPEELLVAYGLAGPHLQGAPECLGYDIAQCAKDGAIVIVRIEWISSDGHTEGFRGGPNFPPFLAAIRPFISEIEEMRHYVPTSLSWRRAG